MQQPAAVVVPPANVTVTQPKAETILIPAPQVTVNNKIDVPTAQNIKVQRNKEGLMTGIDVTRE